MLRNERKRSKKVLVLYLMFVVLFSSVIANSLLNGGKPPITEIRATANGKLQTTLKIEVFGPDGILKEVREKKDDLLLNNFLEYMYGELNPNTAQTSPLPLTCYDDGGTSRTFSTHLNGAVANTIGDSSTGSARKGGFIGIGTGTNAPARADNALQTKVEAYTAVTTNYPTWDTSTGYVVIPSQIAITAGRAITEACLGVYLIDSAGTLRNVLMFRDTFTAINVVNLDIVAVTYTIDLQSTSFVDNFAYYIFGIFENVADGGISGIFTGTKRSQDGGALASYTYGGTSANSRHAYAFRGTFHKSIMIGTSSTAVARTQTSGVALVETQTPYSIQLSTTASTITITVDIPCGSARTCKEAVLFTDSPNSSYYFMLMRVTYADVSVPAGGSIRVVLTITC